MKMTGLRLAQTAAVLFALAAGGWIVMLAHQGANPEAPPATPPKVPPTPAAPGQEETTKPDPTKDPGFMFSSKSGMPFESEAGPKPELPGQVKPAEEEKKPKKKRTFFPSSKSIPISESLPEPEKAPAKDGK